LCQESAVGIKLQLLDVMQTQVDERGIRSVVERCTGLSSLKWRNTINALGQIYRDLASGTSTSHITTPPSYSLHQLISDSSYRLYSLQGAVQLCRQAVQVGDTFNELIRSSSINCVTSPDTGDHRWSVATAGRRASSAGTFALPAGAAGRAGQSHKV
jgi:hypothetical protein